MILKIKAFIYRLTGIYLAYREESEHLCSVEFEEGLDRIMNHPENNMSAYNATGLLIGMWQAKHGFTRRWRP